MIFLFEGIDKSGKSTLINNFSDLSGMPIYKNKIKPESDKYKRGFSDGQYYGAYEAMRLMHKDMLFDRSHVTELAYAKIKRGYIPNNKFWREWEEANSHWIVLIYIDQEEKTLRERFKSEKEEYVKAKEIKSLAASYKKVIDASKLSLVYIDGTKSKQNMVTQLVIQLKNLGVWTSTRNR